MRYTLLDRRIGLLFAIFLVLLGLAGLRAVWLGTVKADSLSERAATQQVEDLEVPAGRGTITDRNGVELAVSEEATTVFANPMLIKDPTDVAAQLAPLLGRDQSELLPLLSDDDKGFVYLRRKLDPTLGDKIAKLRIEGIDTVSEPNRTYPQGALAGQLLGSVGVDGNGLSGIEQQFEQSLHGEDGGRRVVKDAPRKAVSIADTKTRASGRGPPAHARRGDPGARRDGARPGRARLPPQGCDRAGDGSPRRRDPGHGQLACADPNDLERVAKGRPPEPRRRLGLRARIHIQGVHGGRRARGRQGHAGKASWNLPSQIQVADRTSARRTTAARSR